MIQNQFKKLIRESAVQSYIFSRKESMQTGSMLKFDELSEVYPLQATQFDQSTNFANHFDFQTDLLAQASVSKQYSVVLMQDALEIF